MSDTAVTISKTLTPGKRLAPGLGIPMSKTMTPSKSLPVNLGIPISKTITPSKTAVGSISIAVTIVKSLTPSGVIHKVNLGIGISKTLTPSKAISIATGVVMHKSIEPSGRINAGIGEAPCLLYVNDLQNRVWDLLDDDGTYYTPAEVLHALNVAQRVFCLLTFVLQTTFQFELTNGQALYTISSQIPNFLKPLRVSYNGVRLIPETIHTLNLLNDAWQATPGPVTHYFQEGFDLLGIYPQPASGTNYLTFTYAAEPQALVGQNDAPQIPAEQQIHLVDFACWWCRLKEGGAELQEATEYLKRFLGAAQHYQGYVMSKSRGQLYDTKPMDISTVDKSRFEFKQGKAPQGKIKTPKAPKPPKERAE
jgi:hypothetical protein